MAVTNSLGIGSNVSRCSVSETRMSYNGAAIPASTVRSITASLRFAYAGVEANTVATGGNSSNFFTTTGP